MAVQLLGQYLLLRLFFFSQACMECIDEAEFNYKILIFKKFIKKQKYPIFRINQTEKSLFILMRFRLYLYRVKFFYNLYEECLK